MKTIAILPLLLVAATPALADSPFDGTWKTDVRSVKLDPKPDEYLLAGGSYSCKTCKPPVTVPADGQFHPVTGHDYYDAAAVRVDDPHAVTIMLRRGPKLVTTMKMSVSADGKTLTLADSSTSDTGVKSSGTSTSTRVAAAPAGAHPVSGSWKPLAVQTMSDTGKLQTIRIVGDTMTLSVPTGEGYSAKLGGPPVLQKNDPGRTMIAVRRLAPNHIVEQDMRHGKVVLIFDMTVAPDGRTMTMMVTDKRDNTTNTVTMMKQ